MLLYRHKQGGTLRFTVRELYSNSLKTYLESARAPKTLQKISSNEVVCWRRVHHRVQSGYELGSPRARESP